MKISSKSLLCGCLLAASSALFAQSADSINVATTMTIDPLGDGIMKINTTLTAQQFANWQEKYGQDQGLLRRDMTNNYVGQYDTFDWDVKTDTMNRVVTVSVKAHGMVIPRGGGAFEFRVPKSWRGGERNATTYSYNYANSLGNGLIEQDNIKLVLPATASQFTEDKSETGDPIIQYHVPVGGMSAMLLYAGAAFLVLGLLVIILAITVIKQPRPVPA
jgi:hypothetical protein